MRPFTDDTPGTGNFQTLIEGKNGIRVRGTPLYVEVEFGPGPLPPLTSDALYRIIYVSRRDEHSWWVLACLNDLYTAWFRGLSAQPASSQDPILNTAAETWPLMFEGLQNWQSGTYNPAALQIMEDPDDATPKWFVASVIGNIPSEGDKVFEEMFSERGLVVMNRVAIAAAMLFVEINTKKLDALTLGARVFRASVWSDLTAQGRFLKDNLGSIVKLLDLGRE